MQIIKLDATASTNGYLKQLSKDRDVQDFTVVICNHQTQGRGQKGNSWISDRGKNLTVSILKRFDALNVDKSFGLNCLVSLAIYDVLNELSIPEVKVKWPNDIMSGNQKICGILIENNLSGPQIKQSIIGFGLNVNQVHFENLPNATSMKLKSGTDYQLKLLLGKILNRVTTYFENLKTNKFKEIKEQYETVLFRKDLRSKYLTKDETTFFGTIKGVTNSGLLRMEKDSGQLKLYNFKEIQFVY